MQVSFHILIQKFVKLSFNLEPSKVAQFAQINTSTELNVFFYSDDKVQDKNKTTWDGMDRLKTLTRLSKLSFTSLGFKEFRKV
jgi:hypothetical protein